MRFLTDNDELSITLDLDDEPVDLTANGLGDLILKYAAAEMHASATAEQTPDGTAWPDLAASTIRAKKNSLIGIQSGAMLAGLLAGETEIEARTATWRYPENSARPRAHGFHNGRPENRQPARRLVGWTAEARLTAADLIRNA